MTKNSIRPHFLAHCPSSLSSLVYLKAMFLKALLYISSNSILLYCLIAIPGPMGVSLSHWHERRSVKNIGWDKLMI